MKGRILIIEDEEGLIITIRDRLSKEGFEVEAVNNGDDGFETVRKEHRLFDCVILDLMLPGKDGLSICIDLRGMGINIPILMLTAKREVTDRIVGLKVGADDYLGKPFEMLELIARVEALLWRSRVKDPNHDPILPDLEACSFGPFCFDHRKKELLKNDLPLDLSAQEYRLLAFFVTHEGEVLSRNELLDGVWGYDVVPSTRTVDVHIARLRQKLEEDPKVPQYILTIRGRGYKFVK